MKNIKTYEEYKGITFEDWYSNIFDDFLVPHQTFTLQCYKTGLIDLMGIDKFANLEILLCFDNELTSLEGVENLKYLKRINCQDNKISNLNCIKNLPNLVEIRIENNKLTSLKGVEDLNLKALCCEKNPIDWVDYIDKEGRTYYIKLPRSLTVLDSDKFRSVEEYWEFYDQNQPVAVSRKFNF